MVTKLWVDPPAQKSIGWKYPWRELEVGDSFFVLCKCETPTELNRRLGSIARTLTHVSSFLKGRKFTTETVDEYGIAGVIVRRVA